MEKSEKYKNNVCLCILVLVYLWMAFEIRFLKLCIFCNLDEHLHAQLSNVSFVARCVICMIWLILYHSYLYHSFDGKN